MSNQDETRRDRLAKKIDAALSGFGEFEKLAPIQIYGPFPYTTEDIDEQIVENKLGSYRLGNPDGAGNDAVGYVGRSDNDLRDELRGVLRLHQTCDTCSDLRCCGWGGCHCFPKNLVEHSNKEWLWLKQL